MSIFATKSIERTRVEAADAGEQSLKRVLGPVNLVTLGFGAIIGTGIFVLTGPFAHKPVTLKIGEPIRVTADYTERSGQVYFSLKFLGLQQEQVRFTRGATEPKGPRMILASADGSYKSTNTFEFG